MWQKSCHFIILISVINRCKAGYLLKNRTKSFRIGISYVEHYLAYQNIGRAKCCVAVLSFSLKIIKKYNRKECKDVAMPAIFAPFAVNFYFF